MLRHGKTLLILALATGLAAASASAQTSNPAAKGAAPTQAAKHAPKMARTHAAKTKKPSITESCDVDMALFCGDLESKGARVARCLRDNKASVSQGCAAAL